jgi:hypothetical protein
MDLKEIVVNTRNWIDSAQGKSNCECGIGYIWILSLENVLAL